MFGLLLLFLALFVYFVFGLFLLRLFLDSDVPFCISFFALCLYFVFGLAFLSSLVALYQWSRGAGSRRLFG